MGCLNSNENFSHWFGNIHLSGPCNRSCYFCIGQHMMALDPLNNLDKWPLDSIEKFVGACKSKGVSEVNLTGSNTDPLLYKHTPELRKYLKERIPQLVLGARTNGVSVLERLNIWKLYDKASITVCSFDIEIYHAMMGQGQPSDLNKILEASSHMLDVKVNIVLGPENVNSGDVFKTLDILAELGMKRANLREPYGQPHVGDPMEKNGIVPNGIRLGMPYYDWKGVDVTYWDVHYVEVESINLYANGNISRTYPITKGHCQKTGKVLSQEHFPGGRVRQQWVGYATETAQI